MNEKVFYDLDIEYLRYLTDPVQRYEELINDLEEQYSIQYWIEQSLDNLYSIE